MSENYTIMIKYDGIKKQRQFSFILRVLKTQ